MTEHRSGTSIIEKLRRVVLRPFDRGGERAENTDAMAATGGTKTGPSGAMPHHGAPPGSIKTDDGRPRH
jgi:hypothetical protein